MRHAQFESGVRTLQASLDTLESNWAYMAIVSLAWNLKAWALLASIKSGTLCGPPSSRKTDSFGNGVQKVREHVHAVTMPNRSHGSSPDVPVVDTLTSSVWR